MNGLTSEQVNGLADHLRGSCDSLPQALSSCFDYDGDLTCEQATQLGTMVFCCEECGWWCDAEDETEDGHCCECRPMEYDD